MLGTDHLCVLFKCRRRLCALVQMGICLFPRENHFLWLVTVACSRSTRGESGYAGLILIILTTETPARHTGLNSAFLFFLPEWNLSHTLEWTLKSGCFPFRSVQSLVHHPGQSQNRKCCWAICGNTSGSDSCLVFLFRFSWQID